MLRLQVRLHASDDESPPDLAFLEVTPPNITLQRLCYRITKRHDRIYPHRPNLIIYKLQDSVRNDLDLVYTVGDIFTDKSDNISDSVVRVIVAQDNRQYSLPPTSALRCADTREDTHQNVSAQPHGRSKMNESMRIDSSSSPEPESEVEERQASVVLNGSRQVGGPSTLEFEVKDEQASSPMASSTPNRPAPNGLMSSPPAMEDFETGGRQRTPAVRENVRARKRDVYEVPSEDDDDEEIPQPPSARKRRRRKAAPPKSKSPASVRGNLSFSSDVRALEQDAEAVRMEAEAEAEKQKKVAEEQRRRDEDARLARQRAAKAAEEREKAAKIEKERAEQEKAAKAKAEKEKLHQEKLVQDAAEQERLAKEKAEQQRLDKEHLEQKLTLEEAVKERIAKEKAELEKFAKDKAEKERIAKENAEKEKLAKEHAEKKGLGQENLSKGQASEGKLSEKSVQKELHAEPKHRISDEQRLEQAKQAAKKAAVTLEDLRKAPANETQEEKEARLANIKIKDITARRMATRVTNLERLLEEGLPLVKGTPKPSQKSTPKAPKSSQTVPKSSQPTSTDLSRKRDRQSSPTDESTAPAPSSGKKVRTKSPAKPIPSKLRDEMAAANSEEPEGTTSTARAPNTSAKRSNPKVSQDALATKVPSFTQEITSSHPIMSTPTPAATRTPMPVNPIAIPTYTPKAVALPIGEAKKQQTPIAVPEYNEVKTTAGSKPAPKTAAVVAKNAKPSLENEETESGSEESGSESEAGKETAPKPKVPSSAPVVKKAPASVAKKVPEPVSEESSSEDESGSEEEEEAPKSKPSVTKQTTAPIPAPVVKQAPEPVSEDEEESGSEEEEGSDEESEEEQETAPQKTTIPASSPPVVPSPVRASKPAPREEDVEMADTEESGSEESGSEEESEEEEDDVEETPSAKPPAKQATRLQTPVSDIEMEDAPPQSAQAPPTLTKSSTRLFKNAKPSPPAPVSSNEETEDDQPPPSAQPTRTSARAAASQAKAPLTNGRSTRSQSTTVQSQPTTAPGKSALQPPARVTRAALKTKEPEPETESGSEESGSESDSEAAAHVAEAALKTRLNPVRPMASPVVTRTRTSAIPATKRASTPPLSQSFRSLADLTEAPIPNVREVHQTAASSTAAGASASQKKKKQDSDSEESESESESDKSSDSDSSDDSDSGADKKKKGGIPDHKKAAAPPKKVKKMFGSYVSSVRN